MLRGHRVPIAGTVSMDMTMVDLTAHPERAAILRDLERPGHTEWAHWMGAGQSAEEVADAAGTITYELLCALARRLPRRVVEEAP